MLPHEKQILEYEKTIARVKEQNQNHPLWSEDELHKLETKLEQLKNRVYSNLTAWERVAICRHPGRPRGIDYIKNLCEDFTELSGDRLFRDDSAIIAGLGTIGGVKFMILAQEKGCDTKSRLERNFGMPHPEGYRKALRCMQMAEKFNLPVLSLLDTPGAYPGLSAEERGQGWAIAKNLFEMSGLRTPIIVILVGEGCSGGALGMGVGDVIAMLQHSYYSVISPEGCASILWKDASENAVAASALKIHAEDLLQFEIIDEIIEEPLGGAHHDVKQVYESVKEFILERWNLLKQIPPDELVNERYLKFRKMGRFAVDTSNV
ncbi:MAG: acetyl-CoA carboxylase carboxyltransferase subunit alpha [Chlamydiales bacterium]|nr:acetyl-CoA carboxylase carboxyltransferase subunit alpha [Chlamydiales bacterium]